MRSIIFVGGDKQPSMLIFNWRDKRFAKNEPPKAILALCSFYETSERMAAMSRQGSYDDMIKHQRKECVLTLVEGDPTVLGMQYQIPTEICKYKPIFQAKNIKNKEYIEGVNWLRNFIDENRNNGVCDDYSRLYIYKSLVPEIIRTDVTEEDVYGDEKDNGVI